MAGATRTGLAESYDGALDAFHPRLYPPTRASTHSRLSPSRPAPHTPLRTSRSADTIGAVAAVQIFEAWEAHVGREAAAAQISKGEFAPLRERLRERVHARGSVPGSPDSLLTEVCGAPLSVQPFIAYLRRKYSFLYGLQL